MDYNLTEDQKELVRWLVRQIRAESLPEEFYVVWMLDGGRISEFEGEHPEITKGTLDALANAALLLCAPNFKTTTSTSGSTTRPRITQRQREINRRCTVTQQAFNAVDRDFELPPESSPQVTIGAIIRSMSGGNVQAVGVVQDAEVSQVVNDPDLLRSQVEALTEGLLDEVKHSLSVDELAEYAQAVQALRDEIVAQEPRPSVIRKLVRVVGLLGDIEGTVGLMTRAWALLHPLLLIAAAKAG